MTSALLRPVVTTLCIIACAVAFTVYAQASSSSTTASSSWPPGAAIPTEARPQPSYHHPTSPGLAEYDNPQYGFSLTYPADLDVSDTNESGPLTIYFDSTTTGEQFQIVAFPYAQLDIAAGAYTPHDAYGTNDQGRNLQNVDFMDGDTPVFLFQKGGVMYQVRGMNGQQAWLINILKTWQFTD